MRIHHSHYLSLLFIMPCMHFMLLRLSRKQICVTKPWILSFFKKKIYYFSPFILNPKRYGGKCPKTVLHLHLYKLIQNVTYKWIYKSKKQQQQQQPLLSLYLCSLAFSLFVRSFFWFYYLPQTYANSTLISLFFFFTFASQLCAQRKGGSNSHFSPPLSISLFFSPFPSPVVIINKNKW